MVLTGLAWGYLVSMGSMTMAPDVQGWSLHHLIGLFVMWSVMMVAMMLPSASPMILLFATVHRRRRQQKRAAVPTAIFLLGYLAVWTGYSAVAGGIQWALHQTALLSPTMVSATPLLGGSLLVAALAFLVLVEKLAPAGGWLARAAGVPMIGWGLWLLVEAVP